MHAFFASGTRALRSVSIPAVLALAVSLPAPAAAIYNFTSFDGPGSNGGGTTVNGIDNNGAVVGFSSDNAAAPTLLTNFIRNPDGTFTALNIGSDPLAMANGINDAPAIVGSHSNGTAYVLVGGSLLPLSNVTPTTTSETAFGASDTGLIVGQFVDSATGTTPGFLLGGGGYTILIPVINALVTNAQGVNNHGVVTGFYSADGVHQHGFFYDSTTHAYTLAPDPVIANLVLTQFLGMNDLGVAAGYYQLPDGSQHGLLYDSNTHAYTFLDDPNAAHSGVSITQITGINNSGELTGFYVDAASGLQRGFVANPSIPTPEPGTFGSLALALVAALPFRRRFAARHATAR
ncbi:MAG: hypothetical protein JST11_24675 [Acidobacteria bacterium]|nr:hypothetical protein [Acidobacteriota bacterium]